MTDRADLPPALQNLLKQVEAQGWEELPQPPAIARYKRRIACTRCGHHYTWVVVDTPDPDGYAEETLERLERFTCFTREVTDDSNND